MGRWLVESAAGQEIDKEAANNSKRNPLDTHSQRALFSSLSFARTTPLRFTAASRDIFCRARDFARGAAFPFQGDNVNDPVISPPAIVIQSVDQAFAEVRSLVKRTKDDIILLGLALLKAREACPHGEWLIRLHKAGISPRAAQYAMAKARGGSNAQDCAFDLADEQTEPYPIPTDPPSIAPPIVEIFCKHCDTFGPTPNCSDCHMLRHPNGKAPSVAPDERQPGDDTEAIQADNRAARDAPKQGEPICDWGKFAGWYGNLIRYVDVVGNRLKCKETPQALGCRRLLEEFEKSFKAMIDQFSKTF
jgi:hypothetical protein